MASTFSLLIQFSFIILIYSTSNFYCEKIDHNETIHHLLKKHFYQTAGAIELPNNEITNHDFLFSNMSFSDLNKMNPTFTFLIFTMTDDFKLMYENFNKSGLKSMPMSQVENVLTSNFVYIGSGSAIEVSELALNVDNVLSGQVSTALPVHWFLAKGFLQGMFKSILVVPLNVCTKSVNCAHVEAASIWFNANETMNNNAGKINKLLHHIWAEPKEPTNEVKEKFSKKTLQFISQYSIELALRKMSAKLCAELPIGTKTSKNIETVHFSSASKWLQNSNYFYEFGTTVYSHNKDDGSIVMLPFDKIDFKIGANKNVKTRLANDAMYFMKSKLSSFPKILKIAEQDLKQYLNLFVNQNEQKENLESYLSKWLSKIYKIINKVKSNINLTDLETKNVEAKMNMFQAAFEHYLFTALIKHNKKTMYSKGSEPQSGTITLEIPKFFPFILKTADKLKKTAKDDTCTSDSCPKEAKDDSSDALNLNESIIEDEERNHFHTCSICRTPHVSAKALQAHTKTPFHKIMSLAQSAPEETSFQY